MLALSHKPGAKWARRGERWRRRQEVNEAVNGSVVFWSRECLQQVKERERTWKMRNEQKPDTPGVCGGMKEGRGQEVNECYR